MLAGRYALEAELGRSGTGMVWQATDTVLDRTVAVKVLRPSIVDEPRFADHLTQEAEAAARVSGPGLARLLDSGSDRGVSFLVREHVRGESLRPILRRDGRLPPEVAIPIVVRVLEGLAAAHAAGILHLDVKPENVITDEAGEARLTDLGIGAAVAAAYPPSEAAAILATPTPAPEQLDGRPTDSRTDVFLTGALLFELLSGEPPQLGSGILPHLPPDVPRGLEASVHRALTADPADRYPDAAAFADALRSTIPRTEPGPIPPQHGRAGLRSWLLVPALVVTASVVAIALGLWFDRLELGGPLGVRPKQAETIPSSPEIPSAPATIQIVAATAYDPFGDGSENDDTAPLAIDGDPSTAWRSENYFDATMNNKPGIGLLLDLGATRSVTGFRLRTPHPGYLFGLAVGDDPEVLASLPTGGFTAAASMRAGIEPTEGRYVLLWVTSVVDTGDGNRAEVAEFQVAGR